MIEEEALAESRWRVVSNETQPLNENVHGTVGQDT